MGSVFNKIGGAVSKLITKSITANGTYNAASDDADGYSQVSVNVPLTTKSITSNGTYNAASDNAAGYSQVSVNVPQSSRVPLWTGSAVSNISVNLSGYNWVYLVVTDDGSTTCNLLLQVGGSAGCAGGIWGGSNGKAQTFAATTSGINFGTSYEGGSTAGSMRVTAVYGITNLS